MCVYALMVKDLSFFEEKVDKTVALCELCSECSGKMSSALAFRNEGVRGCFSLDYLNEVSTQNACVVE